MRNFSRFLLARFAFRRELRILIRIVTLYAPLHCTRTFIPFPLHPHPLSDVWTCSVLHGWLKKKRKLSTLIIQPFCNFDFTESFQGEIFFFPLLLFARLAIFDFDKVVLCTSLSIQGRQEGLAKGCNRKPSARARSRSRAVSHFSRFRLSRRCFPI